MAVLLQPGQCVDVVVLDKYGDAPSAPELKRDDNEEDDDDFSDDPSRQTQDRGPVQVSLREADRRRGWQSMTEAHRRHTVVRGTVTAVRKRGLDVAVGGVTAFLPWEFTEPTLQEQGRAVYRRPLEAQVFAVDEESNSATLTRRLWADLSLDEVGEQDLTSNGVTGRLARRRD